MTYEIVGSRILAPYIGTSTYTWTALIGVILAALSLGYWLGGRWADRRPDPKVLAGAVFAAGGLVSLTILLKDLLLAYIAVTSLPLELKAVAAAVLLFAPASVFLGFVPPYAVRLKVTSVGETGRTVGRLYALSTIGSIAGTFAAGFLLIPFLGSTRTLYVIAGGLILLSFLLVPFAVSRSKIAVLTVFVLGIVFSEALGRYRFEAYNLHDLDTRYSRVQIFDTTHAATGRKIRAMQIDPFIYQSSMFLSDGSAASAYTDFYHLVRHFTPGFERTLMIGGAGYSFPKEYLAAYPDKRIEVVEIDPQMTALAERFFRLEPNERLRIVHEDGRTFLNRAGTDQYDAVMLDAFAALFSIPFQLTTIETAAHVRRTLKPGGVVIFNLGGAARGPGSGFLKAEVATYRRVFPQVFVFQVDPRKPPERFQNYILAAVDSERTIPLSSDDPQLAEMLERSVDIAPDPAYPPLTDDHAPVEYYNSRFRTVGGTPAP